MPSTLRTRLALIAFTLVLPFVCAPYADAEPVAEEGLSSCDAEPEWCTASAREAEARVAEDAAHRAWRELSRRLPRGFTDRLHRDERVRHRLAREYCDTELGRLFAANPETTTAAYAVADADCRLREARTELREVRLRAARSHSRGK